MTDNTKRENDFEKVDNPYVKRTLELYDDAIKNFQRTLIISIGITVFFFFIILLPDVTIQIDRHNVVKQINDLSSQISVVGVNIANYKSAINGYKLVQNITNNIVYEIKKFINNLQSNKLNKISTCDQLEREDSVLWKKCNVEKKIENIINDTKRTFNQNVTQPFKAIVGDQIFKQILDNKIDKNVILNNDVILLNETKPSWQNEGNLNNLQGNLKDLFHNVVDEYPDFWTSNNSRSIFYKDLTLETNNYKIQYLDYSIFGRFSGLANNTIAVMNNTKAQLEDYRDILNKREQEISTRLEQFESPIGKISVGLREAITFIPIIPTIGFLISAYFLLSTIYLRKALHRYYYSDQNPKEKSIASEIVCAIAPLWLEPSDFRQKNIVRFIVLAIFFIFFVISCGIVFYSWIIADNMTGGDIVNRWIYTEIYTLCFAGLVYGYCRIVIELRNYRAQSKVEG